MATSPITKDATTGMIAAYRASSDNLSAANAAQVEANRAFAAAEESLAMLIEASGGAVVADGTEYYLGRGGEVYHRQVTL